LQSISLEEEAYSDEGQNESLLGGEGIPQVKETSWRGGSKKGGKFKRADHLGQIR